MKNCRHPNKKYPEALKNLYGSTDLKQKHEDTYHIEEYIYNDDTHPLFSIHTDDMHLDFRYKLINGILLTILVSID